MTADDRAEITELVLARARAVDDGDRAAFTGLLRDAMVVIGGEETTGSSIGDLIAEGAQPTRHLVTNMRISQAGTGAHVESYFTLIGSHRLVASGRYRDRLDRHEGRWTFIRHEILVDPGVS
ncbi:nuclear transport factor 2 family protein [Amycolatopsis keratiniphila]|uniref:nuclear transport factor 2 family protein n=1 Tax=Amycolatopsis keratiniphila TaxID=129921 RepID=UPI000A9368D0|nr:nuclear transport factor 2 family protein [Amycolatopsis keratiniphila]